jgi:hypothetical protein
MAKKIRLTQEEEIVRLLKKEGFRELTPVEMEKEPYKSLAKVPECFDEVKTKSKKRSAA